MDPSSRRNGTESSGIAWNTLIGRTVNPHMFTGSQTGPRHFGALKDGQLLKRKPHPKKTLFGPLRFLLSAIIPTLWVCVVAAATVLADTNHKVYFKGADHQLDVYVIKGSNPGPTLLLLGGIQGDEPGGYLAADLYADLSLKKGNLIVVPRANFPSIVENSRGVLGDMNRKFAGPAKGSDGDWAVVGIIKDLMKKSDFFLNLHDGSGFYAPKWESPLRNPMRFGQSIIIDAERFAKPDGTQIEMGKMVRRVLERVNPQVSPAGHQFHLNNHRTMRNDSKHKEQRLSATYHAVTQVGIPAFGIETSKAISDYRLRVRYQTMVINAFLEEVGIVPDAPRIYLESPYLKYLIVGINDRSPIVVTGRDVMKVNKGDHVRIVHIESNYSRGLSARIKGSGRRLNDLNFDVPITKDSSIEVRKDRFRMASIPVEIMRGRSLRSGGIHFEPRVRYFCVRVNDKTFMVEPGEELPVIRGDVVTILDPTTNLDKEEEKAVRLDLRGFQAASSPYPTEDRGHHIDTAVELQEKYGKKRGVVTLFPLQAKLNNKVFGESFVAVAEPVLEYLILREAQGGTFVAYPDDKLELPPNTVLKIMDVKTNIPGASPLFLTMSGKTVRWQQVGSAGIDASKLGEAEIPLDITRSGRSLGRIWLKQGKSLRLSSAGNRSHPPLFHVGYDSEER